MTTEQIINYYADLLILQYVGLDKAYGTIQALVRMVIMDQLPISVQDAYDIDNAEGSQLDVLGKYAGVTRKGYSFAGPVSLDDSDFRTYIKIAIIKNNSFSSLSDIQDLLYQFFPGQLYVFDYANMHMNYTMFSDAGSLELAQVFVSAGFLPKPMGVQLGTLIYAPSGTTFLGFRTYDAAQVITTQPNTYDVYDTDKPWLTYDYGVV